MTNIDKRIQLTLDIINSYYGCAGRFVKDNNFPALERFYYDLEFSKIKIKKTDIEKLSNYIKDVFKFSDIFPVPKCSFFNEHSLYVEF